MNVFTSIDKATDGGNKRLSIEQIYQKKTQLEHILLRPDTYIGSVEFTDPEVSALLSLCLEFSPVMLQPMWVYDSNEDKIVMRNISYVPGLYKISMRCSSMPLTTSSVIRR